MNKMFVRAILAALILLAVLSVHAQVAVNWMQVHPGIWKAVVGTEWLIQNGGDPAATSFPQKFEVDYIRVYRKR